MNNKPYLQLLTLTIVVMSPVLSASDNPDLRCLIDLASRSVRSRQFERAINDLIAALRVAKRERASNETVSVILSNLGYSYRMAGRCGDAITVLTEVMHAWDRGISFSARSASSTAARLSIEYDVDIVRYIFEFRFRVPEVFVSSFVSRRSKSHVFSTVLRYLGESSKVLKMARKREK